MYELLKNSNYNLNTFKVEGINDEEVASLCLCLETSIDILEEKNKESLNLFYLISLFPAGISHSNLL